MPAPPRGLHETLVTEATEGFLSEADEHVEIARNELREAEAADRIAIHLVLAPHGHRGYCSWEADAGVRSETPAAHPGT